MFDELCEFVTSEMERAKVPGVAVGLLSDGEEHAAGFGVTSVEHPLPVDAETLFQIGSITKTFTATVAMRLGEAGRLDLDEPVRTYLPDLRLASHEAARLVTTRHLLTHTAGWQGDWFVDTGYGDDALAQMVDGMARLPQLTPVGGVCSYCNTGFSLVGRLVEAIAGKPYEAVVKELVFEPLGMDKATFFPGEAITHCTAVGHYVEDGEPTVSRPWALGRAVNPAGGVVTSVRELLRYARAHVGDGTAPDRTRLLSEESIAAMRTPQVELGGGEGAVGLSWWLRDLEGTRSASHAGSTHGQEGFLVLVPEQAFAVVALTNAAGGLGLCGRVIERALDDYLGYSAGKLEPVKIEEAELRQYVGRYTAILHDAELAIRDGELMAQLSSNGGFPFEDSPALPPFDPFGLAFYEQDRVFIPGASTWVPRGEFIRDGSGEIRWLRFGRRLHAKRE